MKVVKEKYVKSEEFLAFAVDLFDCGGMIMACVPSTIRCQVDDEWADSPRRSRDSDVTSYHVVFIVDDRVWETD